MSEKVNQRLYNAMVEVAVCEFWEQKIDEINCDPKGCRLVLSVFHGKKRR
jgi:hypothetical protein